MSALPSEWDQNFSIQTASGDRFVLKIAKSDERREVLDLQNSVLAFLGAELDDLNLPRVKTSSDGARILEVQGHQDRTYRVRLLSWVDGVPLVQFAPHNERVLKSLGCVLARIDKALQAFTHAAMHRDLHWDLKHADHAFRHGALLSTEQRTLIDGLSRVVGTTSAGMSYGMASSTAMRMTTMLWCAQAKPSVSWISGDTVHSAVVCDLAIALSPM